MNKDLQSPQKERRKHSLWTIFQNSQILDWVFILLFAGFLIRLWLSDIPGLGSDISINKGWAESAVKFGVAQSYVKQVNNNMLPNYPPFSLGIFASIGHLYKLLISPNFNGSNPLFNNYIKLPGIIADVLMAFIMWCGLTTWKGIKIGFLGMFIVLLSPAVLYNSTIWGQVDAIHSFFLTASLFAFAYQFPAASASLFCLALLTKMQAIAIAPLFLFLFLTQGKRIFFKGILTGIITISIVLFPFILAGKLQAIINVYHHSVGFYSTLSSNAFNLWWAIFGDKAGSIQDTTLLAGIVSYRTIGIILFGGISASILWIFRHPLYKPRNLSQKITALFAVGSLLAYAFFLFATEMHERYLFPFVFLAIPIAIQSKKAMILYWTTSLLFLLTMMSYLPFGFIDRFLFSTIDHLEILIAVCQVWTFFLFFAEAHRLCVKKNLSSPFPKKDVL